jgi:hypothetical protein
MSISPLRSPSRADPWDALVAREVKHEADIEPAFDRACELSGGLSVECAPRRARLARQLECRAC